MMPLPSHVVGWVVPKDPMIDEGPLEADVCCPCGSRRFDLLFPGQTHEWDGETIPCTAEISGKFFFLIKAQCAKCSRQHLLLDADLHGWNGFVCHDPEQAAIPRPPLVPWKSLECGTTSHEASIRIQTEGKADFVSESEGRFPADRWPDGFGWFSMDIKRSACGKQTREWVSLETM
jgi:hypothetical protein